MTIHTIGENNSADDCLVYSLHATAVCGCADNCM